MNMPKRASCHHFMRRARSAGSPVSFGGGASCANSSAGLSASVPAAAPAEASNSRRVRPGVFMIASLLERTATRRCTKYTRRNTKAFVILRGFFVYLGVAVVVSLFLQAKNTFHQEPLL